MKKVIVEVGSSSTKFDLCDNGNITHLKTVTITFKKNYYANNKLDEKDIQKLINSVNHYNLKYGEHNLYVCGTSIFRDLNEAERKEFLDYFKIETGLDFHIISQHEENVFTVTGSTKNIPQKAAIFVGGGGSSEITIFDKKITEMVNSNFGVVDVINKFPDLSGDIATTSLDEVIKLVKENLKLPKQKCDFLILSGGGHKFFAIESGFRYSKNNLYNDDLEPIKMTIQDRIEDTKNYFTKISLDDIRNRVEDPNWWFATRAMCAFVLVIAEEIGAKYIIPTDVSMVYGIIEELQKNLKNNYDIFLS